MKKLKEATKKLATGFEADCRKIKERSKGQKEWMLRKTIIYVIAIALIVVGAVMFFRHWFDMCPFWAIIGIVAVLVGLVTFCTYFGEKYINYRDKKMYKLDKEYEKYTK